LENSLKKILGKIWFLRDNYELYSKNPALPRRAQQIQNIVELMAKYNPMKVTFADRLFLDNYLGSIQYYLTGYDLGSIHLSSKALEVALLFKIKKPKESEKAHSFFNLVTIAISRGLIEKGEIKNAAKNIVNRRNFTMHDAIAEQAILWVSKNWIQKKIAEMSTGQRAIATILLKPYLLILEKRLKLYESLPNLKWYVSDKSFKAMRDLIVDFLEITIANSLRLSSRNAFCNSKNRERC
jgi:hypothetical protein